MNSNENFNQVKQSDNSAGGDIVGGNKEELNQSGIVINIFPPDFDNIKFINSLVAYTGLNKDFIRSFLKPTKKEINIIQSIEQQLSLFEGLKYSSLPCPIDEIQKEYDNIVLSTEMDSNDEQLKHKILDAAASVKKLDFFKAHRILNDSLELISPSHSQYGFIYREYLITGLILFSKQNDVNGLRDLLGKKAKVNEKNSTDIEYIISLIFQEIFSRDIDLNRLHGVVFRLEEIYNGTSSVMKSKMANSLGLAYRRVGERTGIHYLEKAICIFKEGLELNKTNDKIEVELKDQMAAAHIRIFEFSKDAVQLDTAEKLLKECLERLEGLMDPRDYRLKPRVLNNIGNVYKQRAFHFKEIESAAKAITWYEKAEQFWNEKDANYDWALLRKNIAETKYALGKLTHGKKILLEALKDSIRSTKYRSLKNSPYQWGKTVKLIFSIIILLDELKFIKFIPKSTKRTILTYIDAVIGDDTKWSENISAEFVQDASKVQVLLL